MRYKQLRKILLGALTGIGALLVSFGCSQGNTANNAPKGEEYNYNTDQPFYAEADAFMTIDGKFEEEQWDDCKWLECSHPNKDFKLRMTTRFTPAGLYVGAITYYNSISWDSKNHYTTNSTFRIHIAKEDEVHYGSYPIYNHPTRDAYFFIDAKNSLSLREQQYACASYCEGELNSGNTQSLSTELFLPWEELHYTAEELGMDGMPSAVRLRCKISHPGTSLYPGFSDDGAYQTYYLFNETGLVADYQSDIIGHAIDGEAAYGDWVIDEENKKVYSTTTKTQTIWFKQDDLGNKKSTATDYVAEVTVRGLKNQVGAYAGIMSMQSKTEFSFYTVNVPSIANGKVYVRSASEMDGNGWMSSLSLNKTIVESGYDEDSVRLTVIKRGGDLYYLCNGEYIGTEYLTKVSNKNVVGLYANGAAEFSDWSFIDYTGKDEDLLAVLSNYVWFVNCQAEGQGVVTTDRVAVPCDEGVMHLTVAPRSGYVLTDLLIDGVSVYDDYLANVQNMKYSYAIQGDTLVKGVFSKIANTNLKECSVLLKDKTTGATIIPTDAVIYNSNVLLNMPLQANARGYLLFDLLPQGEYDVNGKTVVSDGKYVLKASANKYHDGEFTIEIDANADAHDYEFTLSPVNWGSVKLNGKATSTTGKLNLYDKANDIYGTSEKTTVKQYLLNTKTSGDYVTNATITVADKTDLGNVVGIMLSAGGNNYILLKSCSWETNKLCVEVYDSNGDAAEISINGFSHTLGLVGGELTFSAVRMGDKIYVCNETGELSFYLDKEGVHTQGTHTLASASKLSQVNKGLKDFFEKGKEHAVGVVQYHNKGGEYWFDVQTDISENSAINYFNPVSFEITETAGVETSVSGSVEIGEKYAENTLVTVIVESKTTGKAAKALSIVYENGEQIVVGNYNAETGKTTFKFFIKGDCTASVLMGESKYLLGDLTLNNASVYQIGTPVYDTASDLYGVDSSGTTWQYYADSKTDSDYAFTVTTNVLEKNGFGHILGAAVSAGGYSYIAFNTCSWEANKLVLSVRDNMNRAKEIAISGFNNSIGAVGGNAVITVVKLDNVFYVYNASGVLGLIIDQENGVTLQDGFTTSANADTMYALNEKIKAFYSMGNENALGFVSFKSGTGKYVFDANMAKGKADMCEQFSEVCALTFTQSSSYQVLGFSGENNTATYVKGMAVTLQVESLAENKKAICLQITDKNGEKSYVFGEYDAQTNTTTFSFTIERGGTVEVELDDISDIISGNGFELGKDKVWSDNPWENNG